MEPIEKAQQTTKQTKQQKQVQVEGAEDEKVQGKKDPETLSEGQRMGLSKQQLRKLEKKLTAKKKKQQKEQKQIKVQEKVEKVAVHKAIKELDPAYILEFNNQKINLIPNKGLPKENEQNILITSALPYVNNVPHLGNIIGCVLSADVYSRFKKLQGNNVLYMCGTDEYGTATEVKAIEMGMTPQQVCDHFHKIHADVYKWFDIGFDYFGRTSTEWHSKITQQIFLNLHKNNKITHQEMKQCYCESCDFWLADRFVIGVCPHCGYEEARGDQCDKCGKLFNNPTELKNYSCHLCKKAPILKDTTHIFIDLPQIQPELEQWVNQANKQGFWSDNSIQITKSWLNMGLKPKCITRDLKWGVSVPLEEYKKKVFYVWFDAPIGYISITANHLQEKYTEWWQNKNVKLFQFMGKDNVPFHTVIFPCSLIAAKQNWTLLHHISTTEYLNYENGKFSKSKGVGVFGDTASSTGIPPEVWRYYLLVNRPEKSDSQFSWEDFVNKNNNQLLANTGNLCNRVFEFVYKKFEKKIPKLNEQKLTEADKQFLEEIKGRYERYRELLNAVEIKEGIKLTMEISSRGNKYLQDSKFWEKENLESGRTQNVINIIVNFIRLLSFLLEPYIPSTSAKINFLLGLEDRTEEQAILGIFLNKDFKGEFLKLTSRSKEIRQPIPLFREFTKDDMNKWRNQFNGKQN